MTRTARAVYPRAVTRDRSQSKSGLDAAMKKGGAGQHTWGSLDNEYDHERAGERDAALEDNEDDEARDQVYFDTTTGTIVDALHRDAGADSDTSSVEGNNKSGGGRPRTSSMTSNPGAISDDDRARARRFRTGSFNGNRTIDLAAIARTSAGASTSPISPSDSSARSPFGRNNKTTASV